jgi:hypothetical protein
LHIGMAPDTNVPDAMGLLAQASRLNRKGKLLLAQSLAGQLGAVLQFPDQLSRAGQGTSASAPKEQKKKEETSAAKAAEAPNPLAGTPEKKEFDAAKKAVSKAKKAGLDQSSAEFSGLVGRLEASKDHYFRVLNKVKDAKPSAPEQSWAEEVEEAEASKTAADRAKALSAEREPSGESSSSEELASRASSLSRKGKKPITRLPVR